MLPVTTIPGLHILSSAWNEAGDGVLQVIPQRPAQPTEWVIDFSSGHIDSINLPIPSVYNEESRNFTTFVPFAPNADGDQFGSPVYLTPTSPAVPTQQDYIDSINNGPGWHRDGGSGLATDFYPEWPQHIKAKAGLSANEIILYSDTQDFILLHAGRNGGSVTPTNYPINKATTYAAAVETLSLTWQAPNDSEGPAVNPIEGLNTLFSANGLARLVVNVSLLELPSVATNEVINFPNSEIIVSNKWFYKLKPTEKTDNTAYEVKLTFENGQQAIIAATGTTVSFDSYPISVTMRQLSGDGNVYHNGLIFIGYLVTNEGIEEKVSFGKVEYSTTMSAVNNSTFTYSLEWNDPPISKALRNDAIERFKNGLFSGNIFDSLLITCSNDSEAAKALALLKAGTSYNELIDSGYSNTQALQLLANWFVMPIPEQAAQTELLAKTQQIKTLTTTQLIGLLQTLQSNNAAFDFDSLNLLLARPDLYDPSSAAVVGSYLDSLA